MPRRIYPSQADIASEPYLPEQMGMAEVMAVSGLPYEKFWALIHAGEFPKPVIRHGAKYWRGADIEHWHANRESRSNP